MCVCVVRCTLTFFVDKSGKELFISLSFLSLFITHIHVMLLFSYCLVFKELKCACSSIYGLELLL